MKKHLRLAASAVAVVSPLALFGAQAASAAPSDVASQRRVVITDQDGTQHIRYARTYKGLRVIGGDYVVHQAASGTKSTDFNRREKIVPNVQHAAISPDAAKALALSTAVTDLEPRTAELVVFNGPDAAVLAYDVVVAGTRADGTPTRLHSYVDATTGAVLDSHDEVEQVTGTGTGVKDGQVSIETSQTSGGYTLADVRGDTAVDMNGKTRGTGSSFFDADNVWGNGTQADRSSAAVDALFGAQATYAYYSNVQGRAGIWNTGKGAPSRVHYGRSYSNAFWDGKQMTYGDGANNANPLTEIDVAAHEMSHGVTENTANLAYSGEAGGLNEATSDIFGTAVEWNANLASDTPDYLIGEKSGLGTGGALRYMDKPSKDGSSKDCWSRTLGSLDPHYSSGPLNHWYYLVSEGSGAKTINGVSYNSPTCNNGTVTGVSHQVAEKVWYRALSVYLTSNATYADAREAAVKSAKDLYGAGSAQCTAVAAGFDAINVPKGATSC